MGRITGCSRKEMCLAWSIVVLLAVGRNGVSLPPGPENAALLYYQAFLLRPEPNEAEEELVYSGTMETGIRVSVWCAYPVRSQR